MASVKLIDQPPADEVRAALYSAVFAAQGPQEDICLTLLSDLSNLVPPDAYFDFHVDGLEISKVRAFSRLALGCNWTLHRNQHS